MSRRKKASSTPAAEPVASEAHDTQMPPARDTEMPPADTHDEPPLETTHPDAEVPPSRPTEPKLSGAPPAEEEQSEEGWEEDPERTVNLAGEDLAGLVARDDAALEEEPAPEADTDAEMEPPPAASGSPEVARAHLKGLLEALIFVSDSPIKTNDLARAASARAKEVRELLDELREEYATRGLQLDEVASGWVFRTNAQFAPWVRDLTKQKPVRLTRAQVETLAILAYRQPITRPEIDEIRGVDSGATLKLLLDRELVKIIGKKDEPGRPLLYGTTPHFLEFFGLKSLKDLPTLKEFTELNEDSKRVVEEELGEELEARQPAPTESEPVPAPPEGAEATEAPPEPEPEGDAEPLPRDTLPPQPE